MNTLPEIGQMIVTARKHLGLRQIDLAKLAGSSRATLDALENGRATEIRWSKLMRILRSAGLDAVVQPAARGGLTLDRLLAEAGND